MRKCTEICKRSSCSRMELVRILQMERSLGSPPRINVYILSDDVRYTPTRRTRGHSATPWSIGARESKNLWPPRKRHGGCSFSVFTRQGGSPVIMDTSRQKPTARARSRATTSFTVHTLHIKTAGRWIAGTKTISPPIAERIVVLDGSGGVRVRTRAAAGGEGPGHGLTCGRPRATSQAHPWI